MPKGYHHLTYIQRSQIVILKDRGDSLNKIAKALNVHHTTISRELKRNAEEKEYKYEQAQAKTTLRRPLNSNSKKTPQLIAIIREKLRLQWSPVQISGWLKRQGKAHVSHETIYKYIWKDKKQGGDLYKELRHHGKKYNKRSKGTAGRGLIPGRIDIDERPPIVDQKTRLGDWEIDTIIGVAGESAVVSMVERTSKLTKLVKVDHKTAKEVGDALVTSLKPIKAFVYTLTSDNGKEFAYHQMVSRRLEAEFYFAKPYHSWERGLNEHTNGLVRQYFPKTTNFSNVGYEELKRVEILLNNRPRKVLDFETPLEAFERLSKKRYNQWGNRASLNKSVYGSCALRG